MKKIDRVIVAALVTFGAIAAAAIITDFPGVIELHVGSNGGRFKIERIQRIQ